MMDDFKIVSPLAGASLALSAHALTDLLCLKKIFPYILLVFTANNDTIKYLFIICSIIHFGMDVGIFTSALSIMTLLYASKRYEVVSCTCICAYYIAIHVPLHLLNQCAATNAMLLAICFCILPLLGDTKSFVVTQTMQKLVIAHTISGCILDGHLDRGGGGVRVEEGPRTQPPLCDGAI